MKNKIPNWVKIICTFGVCMFIFFMIYGLSNIYDFKYDIDNEGNIIIEKDKFIINKEINSFYDEETKGFYIKGTIKNKSKKTYYNVSLNYIIYDLEGNILGNAYAYLDRINSEESWNFKASYLDIDATDAVSYKLVEVNYN